jgi:hypothetical protein
MRVATIRHLFGRLVTGQVVPVNPAGSLRGQHHVVTSCLNTHAPLGAMGSVSMKSNGSPQGRLSLLFAPVEDDSSFVREPPVTFDQLDVLPKRPCGASSAAGSWERSRCPTVDFSHASRPMISRHCRHWSAPGLGRGNYVEGCVSKIRSLSGSSRVRPFEAGDNPHRGLHGYGQPGIGPRRASAESARGLFQAPVRLRDTERYHFIPGPLVIGPDGLLDLGVADRGTASAACCRRRARTPPPREFSGSTGLAQGPALAAASTGSWP